MSLKLLEGETHFVEYEFSNQKHADSSQHDATITIKSTRRMTFEECMQAFQCYFDDLQEDMEGQSELFERELN